MPGEHEPHFSFSPEEGDGNLATLVDNMQLKDVWSTEMALIEEAQSTDNKETWLQIPEFYNRIHEHFPQLQETPGELEILKETRDALRESHPEVLPDLEHRISNLEKRHKDKGIA